MKRAEPLTPTVSEIEQVEQEQVDQVLVGLPS